MPSLHGQKEGIRVGRGGGGGGEWRGAGAEEVSMSEKCVQIDERPRKRDDRVMKVKKRDDRVNEASYADIHQRKKTTDNMKTRESRSEDHLAWRTYS